MPLCLHSHTVAVFISTLVIILSSLSFLCLNARSLLNKLDELEHVISHQPQPPTVIAITETWCSPLESNSLYHLPGYALHRCDRQHGRGGGTLLYVSTSLTYEHLSTFEVPGYESTWIEVSADQWQTVIGVAYRPPHTDPRDFCAQLEACFRKITSKSVLVLGDFNTKNSEWYHHDATNLPDHLLSSLFSAYGLHQVVDFPTHCIHGLPRSCLDLVVSSLGRDHITLQQHPPLGSSDHIGIKGTLNIHHQLAPEEVTPPPGWKWCWEASRVESLKEALTQTDLLPLGCETLTCDEMWNHWRSTILFIAHQYCTKLQSGKVRSQPRKPWFSDQLRNAVKLKHAL